MLEGLAGWFNDPANRNAFINMTGQAGAAIMPAGTWQNGLGSMMGQYSAMQQYNNAMNKQMAPQTQAPTPASITIKYPNAVGTAGSQGDAGASPAPSSAAQPQASGLANPLVPQGTSISQAQAPQTQPLGPMNVGQMMGNYSQLPFLLALRR